MALTGFLLQINLTCHKQLIIFIFSGPQGPKGRQGRFIEGIKGANGLKGIRGQQGEIQQYLLSITVHTKSIHPQKFVPFFTSCGC